MSAILVAGFVVVCLSSTSHGTLTDLPLRGNPSSQSSTVTSVTGKKLVASLALDGSPKTSFFDDSCTHTREETTPWWRVDLQSTHCLGQITLVNRGDCCGERLTNAAVRAGINDDIYQNGICGSRVTSSQAAILGGQTTVTCDPPVIAQFVSVDIVGGASPENILTLCEVLVKEYPMEECLPPKSPSFTRECVSTLVNTETCMDLYQPLASTHTASPMLCFIACRRNDMCTSFDYVSTSGRCRMFDAKDLELVQQSGCLLFTVACGLPKQMCN